MKLIIFEGTADEAERIGLPAQVASETVTTETSSLTSDEYLDNDPLRDALRLVRTRGRGQRAQQASERWVRDIGSWHGVRVAAGQSAKTTDGLGDRVNFHADHYTGLGAFCFLTAPTGKVVFRLEPSDTEGRVHTSVRDVQIGEAYKIAVPLESEEAYEEALDLARVALDKVNAAA